MERAILLVCALLGSPFFAAGQTIKEFPIPTPNTGPTYLVTGPDRAVWFTQRDFLNGRTIGRLALSGDFTEFPIPGANPLPNSIVLGPDGALWFADYGDSQIDRMTTSGTITTFSLPLDATYAQIDMAFGADGNLWFTMSAVGQIGRMTPQGDFSHYPVFPSPSFPVAIVPGPDGALWFCDLEARAVGRITTAGQVSGFPLPFGENPISIAAGDGAVWVGVVGFTTAIVRVDPSGQMTHFILPYPFMDPIGLTEGRDGAIWFVDYQASRVGRLTPEGQLTWLDIPSDNSTGAYPADITIGPDGNLWFTENGDNKIGRIARGALHRPQP